MLRPWYDDLEQIKTNVHTLKDFHRLIAARRQAGYQQNERMSEFYLFGRWCTDSCGNIGLMGAGNRKISPKVTHPFIPDVLTRDEFYSFLRANNIEESVTVSLSSHVAPVDAVCPECGGVWSLRNCHDVVMMNQSILMDLSPFVGKSLSAVRSLLSSEGVFCQRDIHDHYLCMIRNDANIDLTMVPASYEGGESQAKNPEGWIGTNDGLVTPDYVTREGDFALVNSYSWRHHDCDLVRITREVEGGFREALTKAGFANFTMIPVANEYGSLSYRGPWYKVRTDQQAQFRIGWRKRVIEVDWTDTSFRSDISNGDGVTKNDHLIHADPEKLAEYLTRLRDGLAAASV